MRKINTTDFRLTTRSISREINCRIALNLIREHQPISPAELARRMRVTRGVAGVLVQELLEQNLVFECATGEASFDGVGVGIVLNEELLRGTNHIAREFPHVPLNLDGPHCMCGAPACWDAYISNLATPSSYFGGNLYKLSPNKLKTRKNGSFTVPDLDRPGSPGARAA